MDHGLELIIPILDVLEIEVSNILYSPGNIEKLCFGFLLLSWKYRKSVFSIFSYPGNAGPSPVSIFYFVVQICMLQVPVFAEMLRGPNDGALTTRFRPKEPHQL